MNYTYLNKKMSRIYQRKDQKIIKISIDNISDKRLKISKDIDKRLNQILKRLFLDNKEFII